MATVKEIKATARSNGGKGAARAERRAGRVPGVIYGNNQPPVTISVDDKELRQRIIKESALPISLALSVNKLVSKVATAEFKPNAEARIAHGTDPEVAHARPLVLADASRDRRRHPATSW